MKIMKLFLFFLLFVSRYQCNGHLLQKELQEIVRKVNSQNTTWTADISRIPFGTIRNFKYMLGVLKYEHKKNMKNYYRKIRINSNLPKTFDSRIWWMNCTSIAHIWDQGNCGSCWAVSTTTAFSDRICIASKGKRTIPRSAHQVLSCCHKCTNYEDGCEGGYMDETYRYFLRNGVVTGGDFNSSLGCQPYKYSKCDHVSYSGLYPACSKSKLKSSGKCSLRCNNKAYKTPFKLDKIRAKSIYHIGSVEEAMSDIYENGPITITMKIYADFFTYKKGIYQHVSGTFIGYHAVRVIGWGIEDNTQYWLITNSWNESWGEHGTFRIIRDRKSVV